VGLGDYEESAVEVGVENASAEGEFVGRLSDDDRVVGLRKLNGLKIGR